MQAAVGDGQRHAADTRIDDKTGNAWNGRHFIGDDDRTCVRERVVCLPAFTVADGMLQIEMHEESLSSLIPFCRVFDVSQRPRPVRRAPQNDGPEFPSGPLQNVCFRAAALIYSPIRPKWGAAAEKISSRRQPEQLPSFPELLSFPAASPGLRQPRQRGLP